MKQQVLVLSYYAGRPGSSPAEWLDDKVDALAKLGHDVILVSCMPAYKNTTLGVRHYRVPSLSLSDFKMELEELKSKNLPVPLSAYLFYPIAYTLGFLFDRLFILLTKGLGEGKPSWTFPTFIVSLFLLSLNRIDTILSTGGAASSHLAGAFAGILSRTPVVIELQDPLVGAGIGRSGSAGILFKLEKFLVKFCKKIVYVTEQAALEARARHNCTNAICIYPGSRDFSPEATRTDRKKFRFLHLGTLYSTRSMITLVRAIDKLIAEGKMSSDEIELINLGNLADPHREEYLTKPYFQSFPIRPRREAIEFAAQSDVNLIVQHTDPRSSTTIPYKTYDYFNLNCQVLGLTNSAELSSLLFKFGYQAVDMNDVDKIAEVVLKLVRKEITYKPGKRMNILDQADELIS